MKPTRDTHKVSKEDVLRVYREDQEMLRKGESDDPGGYFCAKMGKIGPVAVPVLVEILNSEHPKDCIILDAIQQIDEQHGTETYPELLLRSGVSDENRRCAAARIVRSRGRRTVEYLEKARVDESRTTEERGRAADYARQLLVWMAAATDLGDDSDWARAKLPVDRAEAGKKTKNDAADGQKRSD